MIDTCILNNLRYRSAVLFRYMPRLNYQYSFKLDFCIFTIKFYSIYLKTNRINTISCLQWKKKSEIWVLKLHCLHYHHHETMSECTCLQGNALRQVIIKPVKPSNFIPDSENALHILSPSRSLRGTTICISKKVVFFLQINSLIKTI